MKMPILKRSAGDMIHTATEAISQALNEDLIALILHGPHANSSSDPRLLRRTPIGLLIVLRQIDAGTLKLLAEAYGKIKGRGQLDPMVMTLEEMESSTDVFPITFIEMQRHHRLLTGKDVLDDLEIHHTHLRLRCEQELKNLLLRMQHNYLKSYGDHNRMLDAMDRHYTSFIGTMAAALLLKGLEPPQDKNQLSAKLAESFGLDQALVDRIGEIILQDVQGNRSTHELLANAVVPFIEHCDISLKQRASL